MKIRLLLLCTILALSASISHKTFAVSAYPYPFQYTQPDGSVITIQLKGDEKVHWAVSMDGYSLLNNGQDGWEYAQLNNKGDLVCSGIQAREAANRTLAEITFLQNIPKNLTFSASQVTILNSFWDQISNQKSTQKAFTPTGNKNLVMILVAFTDKAFTKTQADFNNLMNQVGYNLNGAVGSVKDYYLEASYNQFNITTTVVGPYTVSQPMAYYGANTGGQGTDTNPRGLITEAINLADPNVNFANFDNDLDGTVDGVYVIYAGYGEESGASTNTIWAHAWSLASPLIKDGVSLSKYSCSSELRGTSGTLMSTIGVICHEFGHVCGAADYYDIDYATNGSYEGTGTWDIMAGGSWNGNPSGSRPPHFNPYVKSQFNWVSPVLLSSSGSFAMNDIGTNAQIYKYNTTTANEYFLIENRQQTGFNTDVPGHGLMVYHYSQAIFAASGNKAAQQGMYPVCANAGGNPTSTYGNINSSGCPFPGSSNNFSFGDASTPHSHSWAGANTNGDLLAITENTTTKIITFCFMNCPGANPVSDIVATPVSSARIDLSWTKNTANNDVLVAYNTTNTFGAPSDGISYNTGNTLSGGGTIIYKGGASTFSSTGLSGNTMYYYKVWSVSSATNYSPGMAVSAMTYCNTITNFPWTENFENGGNIPLCWTQEQVNNSGIYWTFITGSGNSHPASAHGGTYNATLIDISAADNKTKLITPQMDLTGVVSPTLTFWHTQAVWPSDQDQLTVYYKTSSGGTWTLLINYSASVTVWTQRTLSLPNPSADYYIAFEGNAKYGYGVCLDDVAVSGTVSAAITTGAISGSPFCAGGSVSVPFTLSGSYTSGNVFTAQLSNASGNFTTPVNIGTLAGTFAGTINATIPTSSLSGLGYRIRVVSSTPAITGVANSVNLTVNATATPTGYVSQNLCPAAIIANLQANGTNIQWYASPTGGSALAQATLIVNGYHYYASQTLSGCESPGRFEVTVTIVNQWNGNTSSDWNLASNWNCNAVPTATSDVIIPSGITNTTHITASPSNPAICRNISLQNGAILTIDIGKSLTIEGDLIINGPQALILKSDNNGVGSIITKGNISYQNSGSVKVERWVSSSYPGSDNHWEYLSSPVASTSSSMFTTPLRSLWWANETINNWATISNASPVNLFVMKGYSRKYVQSEEDGDMVKNFIGSINTGPLSISLTRTENAPSTGHGWNLVGNPYPGPIDWDASGWTKTNLLNAIYFRRNGNICSYIDGIGTGTPVATSIIPAMQAFWVRVAEGFPTGTLSCNNNVRVHNPTQVYKTLQNDNTLHLFVLNHSNSHTDDTYVRFKDYASETFDGSYDAFKIFAPDTLYPQLYTTLNGTDFISINTFNTLLGEKLVPLGFKTTVSGQFTITAEMVSTFNADGHTVYLEDLLNGNIQDLSDNNSYVFSSSPCNNTGRFMLHFNPTITGITKPTSGAVNIYTNENGIQITANENLNGELIIYDLLGQVVFHHTISGTTSASFSPENKGSVFIVKYSGQEQSIIKKVFLK
jgi:M6 family metalloprotease-like protein